MSSEKAGKDCVGWVARDPSGILSPYEFKRRILGADDVLLKITHSGICYGDVLLTRNEIGNTNYPLVPGHEIVGIVEEVGCNVHCFKAGDHIVVGTYVNSCLNCEECERGHEILCSKGFVPTAPTYDFTQKKS